MSASNREAAIKETLKWEGGYSNDAGDPGGPTKYGITIHDARSYWRPGATAADVRAMPLNVAVDIYRKKYWKTPYYDCDKLAPGVDLAVFDYGVNSGPSRAYNALVASVGGNSVQTINKICDRRLAFVRSLGTWSRFGKGWSSRIAGIRAKSIQMAKAKPAAGAGAVIVIGGAAAASQFDLWSYWPWMLVGVVGIGLVWALVDLIIKYRQMTHLTQMITTPLPEVPVDPTPKVVL